MKYIFGDVLEIKNGKNQKAVENAEGEYPIYGSGGIIGYAENKQHLYMLRSLA